MNTETAKKRVETRGRPKNPEGRKPPSQVTAEYNARVIEQGGTFISRTSVRDPELAQWIEERANKHHNGKKNDVAREALEFFFKHQDLIEG